MPDVMDKDEQGGQPAEPAEPAEPGAPTISTPATPAVDAAADAKAAADVAQAQQDLAAAEAKNEAYEQFLKNVTAAGAPPAPAPVAPPPPAVPATDEQFQNQPAAATEYTVNRKLQQMVAPAIAAQEARAAQQDERQFSMEYEMIRSSSDHKDLFTKYKTEIDAEFASNPNLRKRGGAVRTVYDLVVGRHLGEIVQEREEFLKNDPSFRPSAPSTPAASKDEGEPKLTFDQIAMAKNLGISPEDYHQWKDKHTDNRIPDWMLGVDGAERPEGE